MLSAAECFGANLKRARRRAGLSQEELAQRASLHRTAIGLLEHGQRTARIDTLVQLAGALGASVGELMEGIAWVAPESRRGEFVVSDSHRTFSKVTPRWTDESAV